MQLIHFSQYQTPDGYLGYLCSKNYPGRQTSVGKAPVRKRKARKSKYYELMKLFLLAPSSGSEGYIENHHTEANIGKYKMFYYL